MNNKCCKDCPNRVVGCHETCEKYLEFCKQNELNKQKIHSAKQQRKVSTYKSNRYY